MVRFWARRKFQKLQKVTPIKAFFLRSVHVGASGKSAGALCHSVAVQRTGCRSRDYRIPG